MHVNASDGRGDDFENFSSLDYEGIRIDFSFYLYLNKYAEAFDELGAHPTARARRQPFLNGNNRDVETAKSGDSTLEDSVTLLGSFFPLNQNSKNASVFQLY